MSLPYDKNKISRAQELRSNMTPQEKKLWYQFLSGHPLRFQRQKTIGGFIADFYCAKAMLVIEVDGGQHRTEQGMAYDIDRTTVLRKKYIDVIRFSNYEVDTDFHEVCKKINAKIHDRLLEFHLPTSLLEGGAANRRRKESLLALQIKQLTPTDALPAMALYRRVVAAMHAAGFMQWNDTYPNIDYIRHDTAAGTAWGGWLDGRLAAVATFDRNQSEEYGPIPFSFGEPYMVVHRLAVDPEIQRRGLAARMMDYAEELARAAGCPAVRLDTCEDNAAALALYENRGYIRRGTCHFPGRTYIFIVMEKKL